MKIILNNSSMVPIYEQLISQIKNLILNGALAEGTVLPSVRSLSGELKISALTVKKAYDALEEEGLVATVHGKGTYVKEVNRQRLDAFSRHQLEEAFREVIDRAKAAGLSNAEISELVALLTEE